MKNAALGCLMIISFLVLSQRADAAFRAYTFSGKTNDGKCVSQEFKWDEGRVSKDKIKSQSASVKRAFSGVVKKYSLASIKSKKHISALLTGRVSKDGSVTFNPPKDC